MGRQMRLRDCETVIDNLENAEHDYEWDAAMRLISVGSYDGTDYIPLGVLLRGLGITREDCRKALEEVGA